MIILIPLAGRGQRFLDQGYEVPKPLLNVAGRPLIECAVESLGLKGHFVFIVGPLAGPDRNHLLQVLKKTVPDCSVIELPKITRGPAETCLAAEKFIVGQPVISANCDQIMNWDGPAFQKHCEQTRQDGLVVTYPTQTTKNSYVRVDQNQNAVEFREKVVISPHSLNGIHFWKDGKFFVDSVREMIRQDDRVNGEFYIAPSYNYLIQQGRKIGIYEIAPEMHNAVGTPEDLEAYLKKNLKRASGENF